MDCDCLSYIDYILNRHLDTSLGEPLNVKGRLGSETDLNNQDLEIGVYCINHQDSVSTSVGFPLHWPASNSDGILINTKGFRTSDILQIVITYTESPNLIFRVRGGAYGWLPWRTI